MGFQASVIETKLRASLDAENSDYYRFDLDILPSINSAIQWLVSAINYTFGNKKIGEEIFRELTFVRVFMTSKFSRISLDPTQLGHEIWTILAVMPNPTYYPSTTTPAVPADPWISNYITNITHLGSEDNAKRLTLEEWASNVRNPFEAGNVLSCLKSYAYLNYSNYLSSVFSLTVPQEIEIRPPLENKLVTVAYAKVPTPVVLPTDTIEFPAQFQDILYAKALSFLSHKQHDTPGNYAVSEKDVQSLLQISL